MEKTILIVFALIVSSVLVWVLSGRYTVLLVTTGSMSPAIPVGAVVFVEEGLAPRLGDVVTYETVTGSLITHRVVSLEGLGTETLYYTKGDANDFTDNIPLSSAELLGKVVFVIPYIGYFIQVLVSPLFLFFLFYIPVGYAFGKTAKKFVNPLRT